MIESFRYAVENHYWYNMVVDELPIWAMVGELRIPNASAPAENREHFVFTHKRFSIGYNDDRVIEVRSGSIRLRSFIFPLATAFTLSTAVEVYGSRKITVQSFAQSFGLRA